MNARQIIEQNFGVWLWNQRLKSGMTQRQFGKKLRIGKSTVSAIERGSFPEIPTQSKIFNALGFITREAGFADIERFIERWRSAA